MINMHLAVGSAFMVLYLTLASEMMLMFDHGFIVSKVIIYNTKISFYQDSKFLELFLK